MQCLHWIRSNQTKSFVKYITQVKPDMIAYDFGFFHSPLILKILSIKDENEKFKSRDFHKYHQYGQVLKSKYQF